MSVGECPVPVRGSGVVISPGDVGARVTEGNAGEEDGVALDDPDQSGRSYHDLRWDWREVEDKALFVKNIFIHR